MLHELNLYSGSINPIDLPKGHIKSAVVCFHNQRRRCYNKKNPRYKTYGANGITVEYSLREFVTWYLQNIKTFKGKNPCVGRIDHLKNYSFENIRFESLAENSLERINRVGTTRPKRKVIIIDYDSGEQIFIADSVKMAGQVSGVSEKHIPKYCRGKLKRSKDGFTFIYA